MYSGQIVEEASVKDIFQNPSHPYTKGLIQSVPDMRVKKETFYSIPSSVPKPGSIKTGCQFAPRCEFATDRCFRENPPIYEVSSRQKARCFLMEKDEGKVLDKHTVES